MNVAATVYRTVTRATLGTLGRGVKAAMRWASSPAWSWSFGRSRRYAMDVGNGSGSSIVMACVNWVCRTFPEAPMVIERRDLEGVWNADVDHECAELLENPNPYYSGALLSMATEADYALSGNAYWIKLRGGDRREEEMGWLSNGDGKPVQLWWAPESSMQPCWPEDGSVFISHYEYKVNDAPLKVRREDVVHHRFGLDPNNPRKGLSPLASLIREIYTDEQAAAFSATLLANLGVPGVVISPDDTGTEITPEDADGIREQFDGRFKGEGNGGTAVLSGKAKITVLSFSPQQMNLKDMRRLPEERVTAVMGIPAIVAGLGAGLDRSTFSNFAEAREAAYESHIIPRQRLLSADLRTQLLGDFGEVKGVRVGFDNTQVRVLQDDQNKLVFRLAEGVRSGAVQIAEMRSALRLPVTDADRVYLRYFAQAEVPAGESAAAAIVLPPAKPAALPAPAGAGARPAQWKARSAASEKAIASAHKRLAAFLSAQAGRIAARILDGKGAGADELKARIDRLMAGEFDSLKRLVGGLQLEAVVRGWDTGLSAVGVDDLPFVRDDNEALIGKLGARIVDIDDTTRNAVADAVATARERGYSAAEIVNGVPDEGFAGIRDMGAFGDARAEMIARTELANAENVGQVAAWRETGIVTAVKIIDGDQDEPCAEANGAEWTLDEFEANPTSHPNCTRVGVPVVGGR